MFILCHVYFVSCLSCVMFILSYLSVIFIVMFILSHVYLVSCLSSPSFFTRHSAERFKAWDFISIRMMFQVTHVPYRTVPYRTVPYHTPAQDYPVMAIRKLSENNSVENLSVLSSVIGEISRNSGGEHLWNKEVYWTTWNHPTCKKEAFYMRDSRAFLGETSLEESHKTSRPSIPAV